MIRPELPPDDQRHADADVDHLLARGGEVERDDIERLAFYRGGKIETPAGSDWVYLTTHGVRFWARTRRVLS